MRHPKKLPPLSWEEILTEDYAKKMLRGRRKHWNATIRKPVLDFIDLIAAFVTAAWGQRIYRNDVVEAAFAFLAKNPEIFDKFLDEAFGLSIYPDDAEPAVDIYVEPTGEVDEESGLDIAKVTVKRIEKD